MSKDLKQWCMCSRQLFDHYQNLAMEEDVDYCRKDQRYRFTPMPQILQEDEKLREAWETLLSSHRNDDPLHVVRLALAAAEEFQANKETGMNIDKKMPLQPIEEDEHGVIRFRENRIVKWLLDAGPFDMNKIAMLPGISNEEHRQFAQLIGYSVSGWGDLSYVEGSEELVEADRIANELYEETE